MKRLVLLGGGHSHLFVLAALGRRPVRGTEVVLISPHPRQMYAAMLPGWVAGHYRLEQCVIRLDRLAERAGCSFRRGAAARLDLGAHEVIATDGTHVAYDLLSIDVGSDTAGTDLPGWQHVLPIRPIEDFVRGWQAQLVQAPRRPRTSITVVGGGAGGVELLLAMQHRLDGDPATRGRCSLALVTASPSVLPEHPEGVRRRVTRIMAQRGIEMHPGRSAGGFTPGAITLDSGERMSSDFTVLATGADAPDWPLESGLATDEKGFIQVNPCLQSISHPEIFAAGDVSSMMGHPHPRSGVYAVRAGPVLAANLRRMLTGRPLKRYRPQSRALYLISTGGRHAVASWSGLSWSGAWVWRWKDHIDRNFIARYQP